MQVPTPPHSYAFLLASFAKVRHDIILQCKTLSLYWCIFLCELAIFLTSVDTDYKWHYIFLDLFS